MQNVDFMQRTTKLYGDDPGQKLKQIFVNTIPIIVPIFDGTKALSPSMRQWLSLNFKGVLDDLDGPSGPGEVDVRVACGKWWYYPDSSSAGNGQKVGDGITKGTQFDGPREDRASRSARARAAAENYNRTVSPDLTSESPAQGGKLNAGNLLLAGRRGSASFDVEAQQRGEFSPLGCIETSPSLLIPHPLPSVRNSVSFDLEHNMYQESPIFPRSSDSRQSGSSAASEQQQTEGDDVLRRSRSSGSRSVSQLSASRASSKPRSPFLRNQLTLACVPESKFGDAEDQDDGVSEFTFDDIYKTHSASSDVSVGSTFSVDFDMSEMIIFHILPIVKRSNHRKHNSHEWFFNSVCMGLNHRASVVFLTDCGTTYHNACLARLYYELYFKKDLIGVTASQKVETPNEFFHPCEDCPFVFLSGDHSATKDKRPCWKCYATYICSPCPLQGFEFEATLIMNSAMFNLVEALPVMPGPCQLLDWQKMKKHRVVDEYFNLLFKGESDRSIPRLPSRLRTMSGGNIRLHSPKSSPGSPRSVGSPRTSTKSSPKSIADPASEAGREGTVAEPPASPSSNKRKSSSPRHAPVEPVKEETSITFTEFLRVNMRLAEDRILSFVCVFSTGYGTKWIPGATFFYQPEIKWQTLLTQRRRWLNGTFASFLFFFNSKRAKSRITGGMFDSHKAGKNIRLVNALWSLQLFQLMLVLMSPAVFGSASYIGLKDSAKIWPTGFSWANDIILGPVTGADLWLFVYLSIYALWTLYSYFQAKMPELLCRTLAIVGFFFVFPIYFAVWTTIFTKGIDLVDGLVVASLGLPVVIALAQSATSAMLYVLYLPWFLFLILFFLVYIPSYSFARLWDTTWGNRAGGADSAISDKITLFMKKYNFIFICCLITFNIGLSWGLIRLLRFGYSIVLGFMFVVFCPMIIQLICSFVFLFIVVPLRNLTDRIASHEEHGKRSDSDEPSVIRNTVSKDDSADYDYRSSSMASDISTLSSTVSPVHHLQHHSQQFNSQHLQTHRGRAPSPAHSSSNMSDISGLTTSTGGTLGTAEGNPNAQNTTPFERPPAIVTVSVVTPPPPVVVEKEKESPSLPPLPVLYIPQDDYQYIKEHEEEEQAEKDIEHMLNEFREDMEVLAECAALDKSIDLTAQNYIQSDSVGDTDITPPRESGTMDAIQRGFTMYEIFVLVMSAIYFMLMIAVFYTGKYQVLKEMFVGTKTYFTQTVTTRAPRFIAHLNEYITFEAVLIALTLAVTVQGYFHFGRLLRDLGVIYFSPLVAFAQRVFYTVYIPLKVIGYAISWLAYETYVMTYNYFIMKITVPGEGEKEE
eukprot:gene22158-28265_t